MPNLTATLTPPLISFLTFTLLFLLPHLSTSSGLLRLPLAATVPENLPPQFEFLTAIDDEIPHNDTALSLIQTQISSYLDIQYFITLHFGESREGFRVLLDTGSSWLWVPHHSFKGNKFHHKYTCKAENSCNIIDNKPRTLRYGKGETNGLLAQGKVCLNAGGDCVDDQAFILIVDQTDFEGIQGEGILGLGIKERAGGYNMLLTTLKEQGIIQERVFSLYLEGKHHKGAYHGELILGGVSKEIVGSREIVYEDVVSTKYWTVDLGEIRVTKDGQLKRMWASGGEYQAMIDSGTSCIHIPYTIYDEFMRDLEVVSGVRFPPTLGRIRRFDCRVNMMKRLPTLELVLGGAVFKIDPEDYVLNQNNTCFVMFQQSPSELVWVLGDVFMHTVYTIFDLDRKRVGFVQDNEQISEVMVAKGDDVMFKWILMGIGCLMCVVVVGWSVENILRKRKERWQEKESMTTEKMIEIGNVVLGGDVVHTYTKNTI